MKPKQTKKPTAKKTAISKFKRKTSVQVARANAVKASKTSHAKRINILTSVAINMKANGRDLEVIDRPGHGFAALVCVGEDAMKVLREVAAKCNAELNAQIGL